MTTLAEKLAATAASMKDELPAADPIPNADEQKTPVQKYMAADGSQRGYQWSGGILRPNANGIYIATTQVEQNLCEALVDAGRLQPIE